MENESEIYDAWMIYLYDCDDELRVKLQKTSRLTKFIAIFNVNCWELKLKKYELNSVWMMFLGKEID